MKTRRIPSVLQHDAMDCGVACISMICEWYGIYAPIPDLKKSCMPTKEGVSLKRISTTLEELGFNAVGGRATTKLLIEKAVLPVILHWSQNHFVVLFKITNKHGKYVFHVSDPAVGVITYTQEEFEKKWISTRTHNEDKGIALFIYNNQNVWGKRSFQKPTKKYRSALVQLMPYFGRYKYFFLLLICGYIIISLLQLILPYLTQSIVDVGIANKDLSIITLILIAQLMLLIGATSVRMVNNWITLHISTRVSISLISDFLIRLVKSPMEFFDHKKIGDTVQRIGDHDRIENFITTQSLSLLYSIITLVVFSIVMLTYNVKIFIVFLAFSTVYFVWLLIFMKKRKILDYKFFGISSASQGATYQLISGIQEAKLQNNTQEQRWKWEDIRVDLFDANIEQLKLSQKQQIGSTFINESKNIVITIIAASLVINGSITLGMMLAIQYIIGQLSVPVMQIANYIYNIQDVKISLERINEIKNQKDENADRHDSLHITDNSIKIKNLSFRYEGSSADVLKNINLTVDNNETVAIVGSSGSGKTTLLKLILQYYLPQNGSIEMGGTDLRDVNVQSLWDRCGVVMQDGYIFSDTIAKNIATSTEEIDLSRLKHAADMARLSPFIESLPLKYNTIVGDDGRSLSSGQRQRLLIARAIYKNADFLFFDEATNALDATNEKFILQNIDQFVNNKTALIIAHRLSTVKNADKIVVLEDGYIVESGTHDELINNKSYYYNLVKNQLELNN